MRKVLSFSALILILSIAFTGCYVRVPRSMSEEKISSYCDRIMIFPDFESLNSGRSRLNSRNFTKEVKIVKYIYGDDGEYLSEEVLENNSYNTRILYYRDTELSSVEFKDENDGIYGLLGTSSYTARYSISEDGTGFYYHKYDEQTVEMSENEWKSDLMDAFFRYSPYSKDGKILYIDEARENICKITRSLHSYKIYSKTDALDIEWTIIYAEDSVGFKFNISEYEHDAQGRVSLRTDYYLKFYL